MEPEHSVRAIWEMTGRLDLTAYTVQVRAVEGVAGRSPHDPRLLISLWIYAYSEKVSSAREVARRCEYHPAYQWLTGCGVVNYHTLADFRVDHQAALDRLFAQLLAVLSSEGLITLEQVVHDGTKVKACGEQQVVSSRADFAGAPGGRPAARAGDGRPARRKKPSARSARKPAPHASRWQRLEQALEELKKVQAAEQAAAEKTERRVSATDPEARQMKQPDGAARPVTTCRSPPTRRTRSSWGWASRKRAMISTN